MSPRHICRVVRPATVAPVVVGGRRPGRAIWRDGCAPSHRVEATSCT